MKGAYKIFVLALVVILAASVPALATDVTFQVDMTVQEALGTFNAAEDMLVTRGSFNGWSGNDNELTLAGEIYTGTFDIAAGDIEYKFVIIHPAEDVWESVDNRTATVGDTSLVLDVVFFNNEETSETADVEVLFRVDMEIQELTNNFDPASDWVVVRGSHANIGNWGGAVQLIEETGNPGVYSDWISFDDLPIGGEVQYKFVILIGGDENDASWESSDNRIFSPTGEEPDNLPPGGGNGYGEITPELVFFSNVGPDDIIVNDLNVIFRVDTRPLHGRLEEEGFIFDVQTGDTVFEVENVVVAGFFNNWPWGNFAPEHIANDAGNNGDETAGDSIFSVGILFPAGSPRTLIYKYGANHLDVEAGFALNHDQVLNDDNPDFLMPVDCWGSPDTLYDAWPFCLPTAIDDPANLQPLSYTLGQNYPNPFNPTTTITFSIPAAELVRLHVFDLLGRTVMSKDFGTIGVGSYNVEFDGSNLSSGVYFYQIETPNFIATKKMLLMK